MLYTLDTNAASAVINGSQKVAAQLLIAIQNDHEVTLNAIAYYEIRRGLEPVRMARKYAAFQRLLQAQDVLPLDLPALEQAALIYQDLRQAGTPLEDADILMAGIARSRGAVLVTHNIAHFSRVAGLLLEDWET